jgi:RES domain-containing protein
LSDVVIVWRIAADTPDYTADDLSGVGASSSGGRWNRKHAAMTYASSSRALACLETVVHLGAGDTLPLNRYLVEIRIPISLWRARETFIVSTHVGWDAEPAGKVSLDWGTTWASESRSVVAEVPSIVVPEEWNVLLNPSHPDIKSVKSKKIRKWTYDSRVNRPLRRVR